jgi:hypothetical protein
MSEPTPLRTVALVCPECGEKLRAPAGDVLFACSRCRETSEIGPRGVLAAAPCVWPVPAEEAEGEDIRLPFWRYRVEVAYHGEDAAAVDRLERMVRPDRVYVPAFRQRSVLVFGDMGLSYTYNPPGIEPGPAGHFGGATLGSVEASRLVEPMVLWRADQIHDVTDIEVEVEVTGVQVVAVPAADAGDEIVDRITGRSWPAAAFLDVGSLRSGATCGTR